MDLSEIWLKFSKKFIDKLMLEMQQDSSVSYTDWLGLLEDYKKLYGKDYERKNAKVGCLNDGC